MKLADYVIIILVAAGFVRALGHVLGSWTCGSCPGCGKCGRPPYKKRRRRNKKVCNTYHHL